MKYLSILVLLFAVFAMTEAQWGMGYPGMMGGGMYGGGMGYPGMMGGGGWGMRRRMMMGGMYPGMGMGGMGMGMGGYPGMGMMYG